MEGQRKQIKGKRDRQIRLIRPNFFWRTLINFALQAEKRFGAESW